MSEHNDRLPSDLRDIGERLTAARATPSALELDALRRRVHGRVGRDRRAPRRGIAGVLRMNAVAAALTVGLVLSSGVGVVLACGSLGVHKSPVSTKGFNQGDKGRNQGNQGGNQGNQGGNQGNQGGNQGNDFGGGGGVWQTTSFHGRGSASFCQYHGPQTYSYRFRTRHGWVTVVFVWDCRYLHFHFSFQPDPGYRFTGFNYRWNNGPSYNCNQSSYDTTGPDGATELSFTTDGTSYNLPLAWNN